MSWQHRFNKENDFITDIRRVPPFKSFCRKCSCHHPLDSFVSSMMKGCICNPAGRRGECGRYVPTDSLEYLEYLSVLKEEGKI
jgi:hypothetical protein